MHAENLKLNNILIEDSNPVNGFESQILPDKNDQKLQHRMIRDVEPLRLLIVEDNPGDYLLLKKALHRTSIPIASICRAERLSEVEAILNDQIFDIAFLDLTLPDSAGIDSFLTLNNLVPHIPIIVLSGLYDMEVALETISMGAQDYLMKGEFDEKLLAKSIQYSFERKKTLEKLKESNSRFEYVTQATFDAVWDCNLKTNKLYWSDNFFAFFGHIPGNEKDNYMLWQELLHPEEKEEVLKKLGGVLESTDKNWVDEYRFRKSNGQYAYVLDKAIILRDKAGIAYRMIGAMQDITHQKKEEHTLKLFQSVIVNANDGVIIMEGAPIELPGPPVVFVNDAITRMTGYTREQWIGQSPGILYGPNSDTKELERLMHCKSKWEASNIEMLFYRNNGTQFWANFSMVPIANNKGQLTHWISIIRDVTEAKNHTKEIEEQNRKLKEIAWIQSHVVRAPLARIMSLVNVIGDHNSLRMTQEELCGHIINSANELDTVIRDIVIKSSKLN